MRHNEGRECDTARGRDATQRGAGMRHSEGRGCDSDTARGGDATQRGARPRVARDHQTRCCDWIDYKVGTNRCWR